MSGGKIGAKQFGKLADWRRPIKLSYCLKMHIEKVTNNALKITKRFKRQTNALDLHAILIKNSR